MREGLSKAAQSLTGSPMFPFTEQKKHLTDR